MNTQLSSNLQDPGDDRSSQVVDRVLIDAWLTNSPEVRSLSEADREHFARLALTFQLNPWKREIHCKYDNTGGARRAVFIVGYEVYIKKAERSGLLDGWQAHVEGSGDGLKGVIQIYRKDWAHPFVHEVYWTEVVQRDMQGNILPFWQKMPRFQLKKVAISQGFRLAFSEEIGGIPYDASELPINEQVQATQTDADLSRGSPPKPVTSAPASQNDEAIRERIRNLVIQNQNVLKPAHSAWIIEQLKTEKTPKQIEGLLHHVEEAVAHPDFRQQSRNTRPYIKSFPQRRNNMSAQPAKVAAGSEDMIF